MRLATVSSFFALTCLGSFVTCGSGENSLLITVQNPPARAVQLSLTATLNGKAAMGMSPQMVSLPLEQFGVVVAGATSGHLSVTVQALDADGCTQGSGQVEADLPGQAIPVNVSLTAQSPRMCGPLTPCAAGMICPYTPKPSNSTLWGIWGSAQNDVWAVGDSATALHFDGTRWQNTVVPVQKYLNAVWGTSSKDVWAVGQTGAAIHYDGQNWTPVSSGAVYDLTAVYGLSSTDVWTVGASNIGQPGEFRHWDGTSWKLVTTGITSSLRGVWASADNDITAVGYNGLIIHYDGSTWTSTAPTTSALYTIWGLNKNQLFAGGATGLVLHNDGTGWRQATVNNYGANVYGLAGDGMVVYGVGNKGVNGDSIKAAAPYDTFNVQSSALGADLTGITLLSSGIGWVSGQNGFLGYFDTRP